MTGDVPRRLTAVAEAADDELHEVARSRVLPEPALWPRLAAVAETGRDVGIPSAVLLAVEGLVEGLRQELVCLWTDLAEARRLAANREWSMRCDDVARRIARLTLLVGPCPWEQVESGPLRDGTYRALHAALAVDPGIDEDLLEKYLRLAERPG